MEVMEAIPLLEIIPLLVVVEELAMVSQLLLLQEVLVEVVDIIPLKVLMERLVKDMLVEMLKEQWRLVLLIMNQAVEVVRVKSELTGLPYNLVMVVMVWNLLNLLILVEVQMVGSEVVEVVHQLTKGQPLVTVVKEEEEMETHQVEPTV